MSIITYDDLDTPVFELDTMRYLFRDGLQGMWIDFLPDYAFADTDLTTPANTGEGIAGYVDRGPYGYNDTQPVITARPILGRVPVGGRRNLLTDTDGGLWNNPGGANTGALEILPDGVTRLYQNGEGGVYTAPLPNTGEGAFTRAVDIKADGYNFARISRATGSNAAGAVLLNLLTGELVANDSTGGDRIGYGVASLEDGWWRLWVSYDTAATNARLAVFATTYIGNADNGWSSTGNTPALGEGILLRRPQLESGSEPTPYQRVGNEYDVTEAGVPSVYYAHYDGADDVLPSSRTIPSISDGCFILVGTAGIWIDNEWVNTTGTLTVGPGSYTGGPSGILPVVGDVLSIIVRDEPLTDQERQKVIQAGVKRGSAGVIVPSDPSIITLVRPSVDTAPAAWVRYHDGKAYSDGAEWQSVIDASPVYTGITSEVIDGQHMVRVQKFWVQTQDTATGGVIYSISDTPQPGFQVHPAFFNAGEEIDQFWIGAYHASEVDNVFESQPNVLPRVSLSGATAITRMEARNTGAQTGWGSLTWHQICAVRLLCLIEIGTPDPRTVIGQGWNATTSNSGSGAELQPTGTSDANWRGIYDLWGNVHTLCTGLEFRDGRAWLADENGDLVDTGHDMPATRYIGACAGGDLAWAFLPTAEGPTDSNAGYTAYQWMNTSGTRAARHGGSFGDGPAGVGLFSLRGDNALGATSAGYGFRIAKV